MSRLIPATLRRLCRHAALIALLGYVTPAVAASPPLDRWEILRAQDLRVLSVAYRISLANTLLCPNALAPQSGVVLHSIEQYDPVDRQNALRRFGLGSYVGVMAIVAGSPAQRSGLAADDQIISVNGRPLGVAGGAPNSPATRAPVARAQAILAEEMGKGEVVLHISGAAGFRGVRFTADIGCASDVELVTGGEVNAWADGERVVISDGILALCASDAELALVIAHELAHNLLRHSERLAGGGSASGQLRLTGAGLGGKQEAEVEADRLAVRLASAAAYKLSDTLNFLSALLDANGPGTAGTHPTTARRLAILKAEIAATGVERGL